MPPESSVICHLSGRTGITQKVSHLTMSKPCPTFHQLPTHLLVYPPTSPAIHLSICSAIIYISINLSMPPFTYSTHYRPIHHPLIHSSTYLYIHLPIHLPIYLFINYSSIHLLVHSATYSSTHRSIHPSFHSPFLSFTYSFIHFYTNLPSHPFHRPTIHPNPFHSFVIQPRQ